MNTLDLIEHTNQLSASLFKDPAAYALPSFDSSDVGVDRNRFTDEILYHFPADSEFSIIVILPLKESNDAKTNSEIIARALAELAVADGNKKLIFPAGVFRLDSTVELNGVSDLYVCGNGTRLIYTEWESAFKITNSQNVHISNFQVTFEKTAALTGKILSYDPDEESVMISVHKDIDITYEKLSNIAFGYYEMAFSEDEGRLVPDMYGNVRYGGIHDLITYIGGEDNLIKVKFRTERCALIKTPEVGTVACAMAENYNYGKACVKVKDSNGCYFESLALSTVPGMGFDVRASKNLFVNRLSILPDTKRGLYISSGADGFHATTISGEMKITNSVFDGIQDDCINVNTRYNAIVSLDGNKIVTRPDHDYDYYDIGLDVGSVIEIFDNKTLEFFGSYTVLSKNGDELTLDKTVDERVHVDCFVGNVSTATALTVDNCIFKNCWARGCLVQVRNSKIINSAFKNLCLCGVRIHSSIDIFKEAIVPKNITVENNKFIRTNTQELLYSSIEIMAFCDAGPEITEKGVIKEINVRNNFITQSGGVGIIFLCGGESSVTNNLICDVDRVGLDTRLPLGNAAIGLKHCKNITVKDNIICSDAREGKFVPIRYSENSVGINEENNVYVSEN